MSLLDKERHRKGFGKLKRRGIKANMKNEDKAKKQEYPTAFKLLILVVICAFVFETVIMFLLFYFVPDVSIQMEAFYDALLFIIMLFPVLYFFLYRPLVLHITERKRVEEELRENEKRFRSVAHSATDAIISADSCGRITFWNKAAETIFDYTASESIGKPVSIIIPERFREKHRKGLSRVVSTGKTKIIGKTIEVTGLRKNGSEVPVELSLARWSIKERIFFTGIIRDITERKRAEAELQMANKRMKSNLEVAAMVQKSLLPRESLEIQGVSFACSFKPCEELGGDILNVFQLDEKHVGLYILDVSGHGIPAALLSVTLSHIISPSPDQSSLLKQQIGSSPEYRLVQPAEVAKQLNRQFLMDPEKPQYFTLVFGILNLETHEFRYVSAGHPGLIYISRYSEAAILDNPNTGFPIGCVKEANYKEYSFSMKPGDRLYLYSDGITDAMNSNDEQFGERQLINALDQSRNILLKDSISSLLMSVEEWCGDARLEDDISVLAIEIAEKASSNIL
jgi:sigma-B regulation protein RsbU (phosphoserine phosphatase)